MFSVDAVISEKLPNFSSKHPVLNKTLCNLLKYLLHEMEFRQFEARYPHLEGFDFVEQALEYFDFGYRLFDREIERLPRQGRVVIVANHPIGSLDGLALLKMVGEHRRDVKVVANDLLYAIKPLRSLLLPVDNLSNKTRKDNIKQIRNHLNNEGAIIIFPAGEVSRMSPSGIRDGKWDKGFLRFAEATNSPVLPLHVNGRNSIFFYALSILSKPLSGIWLIREMFKQASAHVDLSIGYPISTEQVKDLGVNLDARARVFRKLVYRIGKGKIKPEFKPSAVLVANAEDRQLLKQEITRCECLGETSDNKKIYLYQYQTNSIIMREIGRLREMTFRTVNEGSGKRRDIDRYDHYYDQIILWDDNDLEIVGAYRMMRTQGLRSDRKNNESETLYTQTLFDYDLSCEKFSKGLELGRSFVQPKYWGKRSLDYLWYGIGAYLNKYPDIQTLFGPVSLSAAYSSKAKAALVYFYDHFFGANSPAVNPVTPFILSNDKKSQLALEFGRFESAQEAFVELKSRLAKGGESVPTLFKQYTEITEYGGTQFLAFNVDHDFSDCIDGFVMVDIKRIKSKKFKRYTGRELTV